MANDVQKPLTELEHTVLGVIWRSGGCSAYDVRKEFASSISSKWSDSRGSIYPLIVRLEKAGMLSIDAGDGKGRGRRLVTITKLGKQSLVDWLSSADERSGDPNPDPARTRMFFLDALPGQPERLELVAGLTARTKESLKQVDEIIAAKELEKGDGWLAALGGAYQLRARLEWLETVRKHLVANPK